MVTKMGTVNGANIQSIRKRYFEGDLFQRNGTHFMKVPQIRSYYTREYRQLQLKDNYVFVYV